MDAWNGLNESDSMVKLVQLLCPQRHAILAAAYEEEHSNFIETCNYIEDLVGPKGPVERQCMLCGSFDLRFDEQTLPFKTLLEAAPYLQQRESNNIFSRRLLDQQGKTLKPLLGTLSFDELMDYGKPEYFKNWREVDEEAFEKWLASPHAPDYVVHGRYYEKDYFVRHNEKHFASLLRSGKVLIDPTYLK